MSSGHGEKKNRKLDAFVAALLTHGTVEAAAKSAGISVASGYRWMRDAGVIERLRLARQESWNNAMAQLQTASPAAVKCLHTIVLEAESETARVAASRVILETALKTVVLSALEERLTRLEQSVKSGHDQPDCTPAGSPGAINGRG